MGVEHSLYFIFIILRMSLSSQLVIIPVSYTYILDLCSKVPIFIIIICMICTSHVSIVVRISEWCLKYIATIKEL